MGEMGETTPPPPPPPPRSGDGHTFETRRQREFYSYYEAVCSLSKAPLPLCQLDDPASVDAHCPVSSADKALTAFCQLTALRLRSRRAMVFFFDADYAYVFAESTRSLSLQDDSVHDPEDALWLGATRIPRGFAVCEVTTILPQNEGSNCDLVSSSAVHIVNDLQQDDRFSTKPYVCGGPKARFYAGAPITTSNGIHIGAVCALDDQPRDGLDENDIRFLCEMATTIMTHLELVRDQAENQRSRDMTVALSTFKEGKSKLHNSYTRKGNDSFDQRHLNPGKFRGSSTTKRGQPGASTALQGRTRVNSIPHQSSYSSSPPSDSDIHHPGTEIGADKLADDGVVVRDFGPKTEDRNPHATAAQLQEEMLSKDVQDTLSRAADLIRQTLDSDGVLFLDASIGTFGGIVNSAQNITQTESSTTDMSCDSNNAAGMFETIAGNVDEAEKLCPILASSLRSACDDESNPALVNFKEDFLRTLLRRYPKGIIWNFDENDNESANESTDEREFWTSAAESADDGQKAGSRKRLPKRSLTRAKDGRSIQRLFPGVRSVILVGMWDSHKERWFAGSIVWTYSPTRSYSFESELGFMTAFGDVILAEIGRIEAKLLDRSKNDFISSLSHELRSPLHGILGSAECLQSAGHDILNQEMIQSIHTCGTALLDIINNLLEHSRINNLSRQKRTARAVELNPATRNPKKSSSSALSGLLTLDHNVALDILTEEAVETACSGFIHRGRSKTDEDSPWFGRKDQDIRSGDQNVVVTFNVDQTVEPNWNFSVPAGAWKRICLNLITNALKFTKAGHVTVTLHKTVPHTQGPDAQGPDEKKAHVVLTVTDSGAGMSRSFQTQSLFRPFQQEDGLSEGTGLVS